MAKSVYNTDLAHGSDDEDILCMDTSSIADSPQEMPQFLIWFQYRK